jgi:hypothetical protein
MGCVPHPLYRKDINGSIPGAARAPHILFANV